MVPHVFESLPLMPFRCILLTTDKRHCELKHPLVRLWLLI